MLPDMSPWTLDSSSTSGNEVYRRPLGTTEVGFYWDMNTGGIATALQQLTFEVSEGHESNLSEENIKRAWIHLKQGYPILGARAEGQPNSSNVDIIVEQARLCNVLPDEVKFLEYASEEEENAIVYRLLNGPPLLSDDRLSQLWVLRDRRNPRLCQFVPVATHFIMDAMAGATITRELLQELSLSAPSSATLPPLGDRLETILSVEDLFPSRSMSTPRKRWRKAIATVILSLRKKTLTVNLHITFAQETQLIRLG